MEAAAAGEVVAAAVEETVAPAASSVAASAIAVLRVVVAMAPDAQAAIEAKPQEVVAAGADERVAGLEGVGMVVGVMGLGRMGRVVAAATGLVKMARAVVATRGQEEMARVVVATAATGLESKG